MQIKNNTAIFHSANRTISRTISKHMHTYINKYANECMYLLAYYDVYVGTIKQAKKNKIQYNNNNNLYI